MAYLPNSGDGAVNYYVGQDVLPKEFQEYFSLDRLQFAQNKITTLLQGLHPEGKSIVVPLDTIRHVLTRFFDNKRDNTWRMYDNAIDTIVSQIREEFQINEQNDKLSHWVTQYSHNVDSAWNRGIRQVPPIKIRQKTTNRGFVYNY